MSEPNQNLIEIRGKDGNESAGAEKKNGIKMTGQYARIAIERPDILRSRELQELYDAAEGNAQINTGEIKFFEPIVDPTIKIYLPEGKVSHVWVEFFGDSEVAKRTAYIRMYADEDAGKNDEVDFIKSFGVRDSERPRISSTATRKDSKHIPKKPITGRMEFSGINYNIIGLRSDQFHRSVLMQALLLAYTDVIETFMERAAQLARKCDRVGTKEIAAERELFIRFLVMYYTRFAVERRTSQVFDIWEELCQHHRLSERREEVELQLQSLGDLVEKSAMNRLNLGVSRVTFWGLSIAFLALVASIPSAIDATQNILGLG